MVEVYAARRDQLAAEFPGVAVTDTIPACTSAVLAVKPPDIPAVAAAAVAAGARAAAVDRGRRHDRDDRRRRPATGVAVLRAMPNTPALVGEGVSALAAGADGHRRRPRVGRADPRAASALVVRVAEHQLDAVTGLTGSGPAYVFLVAEALIDAGVLAGLPRATVEQMVAQLLVGSAKLLAERGDPAGLRAMVTSPGGTTAAGVRVLEQRATRAAFIDAVQAATDRSRELGQS